MWRGWGSGRGGSCEVGGDFFERDTLDDVDE